MKRAAACLLLLLGMVACSHEPEEKFCAGAGFPDGPVRSTELDAVRAFLRTSDDQAYTIGDKGPCGYTIIDHHLYTALEVTHDERGYRVTGGTT